MPTTDKRPIQVFLCHAHADRGAVRRLYSRLAKDGVDAWLDKEKLLPGQDWELEIRKAVRAADIVVVCLSKQFNQAGFRQKEVRLALDTAMEKPEGDIFIIPARLEECDSLESLRKWHWVDLFEGDGYERLMRALRARAEKIGAILRTKKNWSAQANTQPAVLKRSSSVPVERKEERLRQKREIQAPRPFNKTIIGVFSFAIFALAAIFSLRPLITQPPKPTRTPTETENLDALTPVPLTKTSTLTSFTPTVLTSTEAPIIESTLDIPSVMISEKDQMTLMYIPEGEFVMGVTESNVQQLLNRCGSWGYRCRIAGNNDRVEYYSTWRQEFRPLYEFPDALPSKLVFLDSFWMDKTEVTNSMYALCVADGVCDKPQPTGTTGDIFDNPEFANHPVRSVSWDNATTYCEWAGRRLPTEAEWEKAARGSDSRLYPWGNDVKNYSYGSSDVLSYPELSSPYGVLNMLNSPSEWTADWYELDYYSTAISTNPSGPDAGQFKVLRGSNYVADRAKYLPSYSEGTAGFRCAEDANP